MEEVIGSIPIRSTKQLLKTKLIPEAVHCLLSSEAMANTIICQACFDEHILVA